MGDGQRSVDLRYSGQGYELNVPFTPDYVPRFHELHRQRYGYSDESRPVEIVNARVRHITATPAVARQEESEKPGDARQAITRAKQIYYGGQWQAGNVYSRDLLRPGDTFPGPAVIVEYSATTFVEPGAQVKVDGFGNLVIEV